jgi:hypothetical protein
MRWEYKIVFMVSDAADEDQYEDRLHESMHTLNNLGMRDGNWSAFFPMRPQPS